jgi:hypothetical protein
VRRRDLGDRLADNQAHDIGRALCAIGTDRLDLDEVLAGPWRHPRLFEMSQVPLGRRILLNQVKLAIRPNLDAGDLSTVGRVTLNPHRLIHRDLQPIGGDVDPDVGTPGGRPPKASGQQQDQYKEQATFECATNVHLAHSFPRSFNARLMNGVGRMAVYV